MFSLGFISWIKAFRKLSIQISHNISLEWWIVPEDLCFADCVRDAGEEHKHSAIGKHLRDVHNQRNKDLREQFTILKKCRGKFECLIYEMLFNQEMKPKLNTQSDSIKAKLFST